MTSIQAADSMERGALKAAASFKKHIKIVKIPIADGGEGTVEAIIAAVGGKIGTATVLDPLGREIESFFGILPDKTAVIEMAAASGLNLISLQERNPLITTTYGTGQLIKAALDAGCKNFIIGIGGSATNDGGAGMAQALGVKFLDENNNQIGFGCRELAKIRKIDISGIDSRVSSCVFTVASDVKNVLYGPEGASAVYGPQKGAASEIIRFLDENLQHLAEAIKNDLGKDIAMIPGSGAAGGLGGGLMAFLDAKIEPGIELVMKLTGFKDKVKDADLIITGEGSTDAQTLFGKVPFGIAQAAKKHAKPVVCISGSLRNGYEKLYDAGIDAIFSIINCPMNLDEAIEKGEELLEKATENAVKIYFAGGG